MLRFRRSLLFSDSRGAVAIEYALLAVFLGIALIAGLRSTKNGLNQQFDSAAYNVGQSYGGPSNLAVKRVYAPTALNENGINYTQTVTQYYAPGTGANGVPGACPCTATILRTPVIAGNPYQYAIFQVDSTLTNITGFTQYNNDGSTVAENRTVLPDGAVIGSHTDAAGTYTYRETQTTISPNVFAVTRTTIDDTGTAPYKSIQYVQDNSQAGVSTQLGSYQVNKDGTTVSTGQNIRQYF